MKRLPLLAVAVLLLGVAGCEHLPSFLAWMKPRAQPHMVKITPVPVDLPPIAPNAVEDRLYANAVKAIDARNYAEALDILQLAREGRPNDPRVLSAMGVIYDKLGRFDLSARYYDLAEAADPGSKIVAANRRYSLLLQQRSPIPSAGAAVTLAAASSPAATFDTRVSVDGLYAQAVERIQNRDYTRALALLEWARATHAGDPRVLTAMGVVYDNLGRFDLSGRYYDLAEQADPGSKVVASDRRYSRLLQQHGGGSRTDDVIVVSDNRADAGHAG